MQFYFLRIVKTVIQRCATKLFLQEDGDWSQSLSDAVGFKGTIQALAYCHEHHLEDVRIVLTFGAREYDVVLPVSQSGRCVEAA